MDHFNKKIEIPESPHRQKNRSYYDVFYVSRKNGQTKSIRIHKSLPLVLVVALLLTMTSVYFLVEHSFQVKNEIQKLEDVNYSNKGLQVELENMHKKIKMIEKAVNKIDYMSEEIKSVSTRVDERRVVANNSTKPTLPEEMTQIEEIGIGPLTKSEFEISKKLSGIKSDSLALKELFDILDESSLTLGKQFKEIKSFLMMAKKKARDLKFVPDLAPTRGRVTSMFGWRISPFSAQRRMHFGVDIAAPIGDPIFVTAQGRVVRAEYTEDYGLVVDILHENAIMTRYAHTSKILVKVGQEVNKGQVIALVGNTGSSTGAHVHYEVEVNGKKMNPQRYIVLW